MGEIVKFTGTSLPISWESSCSPKLANSVEPLDKSSPTAPIRALVVKSLALSSPDRDDQHSAPAETLDQPENPDGSSSSSSQDALADPPLPPSSVGFDNSEGFRSQVTPQAQILPPSDSGCNSSIRNENSPHSPDENDDASGNLCTSSCTDNQRPSGVMAICDIKSDDDRKVEQTELGWNSWSSTWSGPQQEPPKIEPTGVGAGLWNLGNTCFMNAILQCFTHTVPLIESLFSNKHSRPCNCDSKEFCVTQVLRDHIELALRSSGDHVSPVRFVDNLNYISSGFQRYHQEDAHEFLQSFLDKLERCCLDPGNKSGYVTSQGVNVVQHVFGGRLVSRLRCCSCNSFSDTYENSLCLSLEIEDVDNLASALESFTCVEKLEDQFTCDSCKEKVSKEKQLMLDKLPLVAAFHLKRFKNDGFFMEKIFKHVEFPLELNLQPYMSGGQENEVCTTYHLYALVEHIGSSLTYGHYSSYVRSAHETWHKFDDSQVTRIEEGSVLSQDAYILFYAREGTPWFSSAFEQIMPYLEANMSNSSPKSVLDPAYRELVSSENINNASPDKPCNLVEEVFQSMEDPVSCCPEPQEEVFHSAESNSNDSPFTDPEAEDYDKPYVEPLLQQESDSSCLDGVLKHNSASVPVNDCSKTHLESCYKIERKHTEGAKKKKETLKQPMKGKVVEAADREIAVRYLNSRPSQRTRILAAAMAEADHEAIHGAKRMKTTTGKLLNRRRPTARRSFPHSL
ncbi:PREDICTED: ubiquitin carboxyl-terminal hydrolase 21-like [Tarenaya hassleriana]|uniref:ubiquitin carboxyl-terminal hydrolase 21-like n=1 Tax=Tarenaya hassleriana TaxID=28532 RepID=UPI00053C810A|nr:PREDICTED: ubiquitin carboxyl-terminal hydrolase 21-like [Tarenaya hassleriana]XP_010530036.1 PREDICTED: ubiquitin carboxyl-terminal hydrolase 21-like [Tarenaya hassleriana]